MKKISSRSRNRNSSRSRSGLVSQACGHWLLGGTGHNQPGSQAAKQIDNLAGTLAAGDPICHASSPRRSPVYGQIKSVPMKFLASFCLSTAAVWQDPAIGLFTSDLIRTMHQNWLPARTISACFAIN
nr:uncharacterized protein LOC108130528 [Drosophila bipectinata]